METQIKPDVVMTGFNQGLSTEIKAAVVNVRFLSIKLFGLERQNEMRIIFQKR